ncbi:SDR family oxidoreductase [Phenylobacterium sp.]|uniref:SDR family oxidoreductase n=1 Tax=Phenylobacterium sp. TaxID=1871053 RepID=UPI003BA8462B
MSDFDRVILTGATGAVGAYFVRRLVDEGSPPTVCILRDPNALERLGRAVGPEIASRITPVFADLTREDEVLAVTAKLGKSERSLVLHCAGEVSWTKSERLAAPINIDGTRRVAQLAVTVSRQTPSLVFLSTAFCSEEHPPRNPYEATKLAAERLLAAEFAGLVDISIMRCSLVVGTSSDGWMSRFNGLYPLIRILALAEVPCLIADPDYCVDCVPVDFVWEQAVRAAAMPRPPGQMLRLVAAAGRRAMPLQSLARLAVGRVDALRRRHQQPPLPEISILAERQFRFLMRSSKSWNLSQRFAKVEEISELMAGYVSHGGSGREIEAIALGGPPPDPAAYMDRVLDFWITCNERRVLGARRPDWLLAGEGAGA